MFLLPLGATWLSDGGFEDEKRGRDCVRTRSSGLTRRRVLDEPYCAGYTQKASIIGPRCEENSTNAKSGGK
jgi:hypothetical protein